MISFITSYELGFLALFSNPISPGDRWKPQSFPRHRVEEPLLPNKLGWGGDLSIHSFPWAYMRRFPLEISFLTLLLDVQAAVCLQDLRPAILLVICIIKRILASILVYSLCQTFLSPSFLLGLSNGLPSPCTQDPDMDPSHPYAIL